MCWEQSVWGDRLMFTSPCLHPKVVWSKIGHARARIKIRDINWSLFLDFIKPYQLHSKIISRNSFCCLMVHFLVLALLFPDMVITDLSEKLNYQVRQAIHLKRLFFIFVSNASFFKDYNVVFSLCSSQMQCNMWYTCPLAFLSCDIWQKTAQTILVIKKKIKTTQHFKSSSL